MSGFQELKEKLSKQNKALDNFGLVLDDDSIVTYFGQPCVASLKNSHGKVDKARKIKYFMSYQHNKRVKKDVGVRYLRWLKTSSPWRGAFVSKAVNKAWGEPIAFKTNVPVQYMISAHIAIRYMQEYPKRVEFWDDLCHYVSPELAFVLIHYLIKSNNNFVQGGHLGGHSAFSNLTDHGLQRFLDKKPPYKNPEGAVKDKVLKYRDLCKIWNGYMKDATGLYVDNNKFIKAPKLGTIDVDNGWGRVVTENMAELKNTNKVALSFLKSNNIVSPEDYILS